jgi:hypothetical protein
VSAHNDRAVFKNGEMNPIAGLEVRSGPHLFGNRRLSEPFAQRQSLIEVAARPCDSGDASSSASGTHL